MAGLNDFDRVQQAPALAQIAARTAALGFDVASEARTGALLRMLADSEPRGRFLELGTGTGMETAWILAGMDAGSSLASVDVSSQVQQVAREFLGSDHRLRPVLEDGLKFLKHEAAESYDFVFADAMAGKFGGLEDRLRVVKPVGSYIVDDMLPQANCPKGHTEKIPVLMDQLTRDHRFSTATLTWATGIVVATRR